MSEGQVEVVVGSIAGAKAMTARGDNFRGIPNIARRIARGTYRGNIALQGRGPYPPYSFHLAGLTVPA
jgi:hypothetical protein